MGKPFLWRSRSVSVKLFATAALLVSTLVALRASGPPFAGVVSTIAGNGIAGFVGDGAAGTSARLNTPSGVAVDSAGNVYIADTSNNRIRKIAPGGVITTVAGSTGGFSGDGGVATAAQLQDPAGVAVDSAGNVYIADQTNDRIRKITIATGTITTIAGTTGGFSGDGGPAVAAQLQDPSSVAVDSAGNVYVADTANHRIRKITKATGVISTVAGDGTFGYSGDGGAATAAQLFSPLGVAVDAAGNVYIADTNNSRVRKVSAGTAIITTVAGTAAPGFDGEASLGTTASLDAPMGVAVDGAGNLYIADTFNSRVRKLTFSSGVITTVAGSGNTIFGADGTFGGDGGLAPAAEFNHPQAVAVDAAGALYIADTNNQRVRKVAPPGLTLQMLTLAGTGTIGADGDGGPATAATMNFPTGVAVDTSGNTYIADTNNHRIRKVTSSGVISTFAGTGTAGFFGEDVDAATAMLNEPGGLAVDAGGNLYIADRRNNRVRKVTVATGHITTVAGSGTAGSAGDGGPATTAELNQPLGVAVDSSGNVYVADFGNNRIRKVTVATGDIATIAGTGVAGYSGDGGAATAAQLNAPAGVAVGAAGTFYLSDYNNKRVRKVASGVITTVVGTGVAGYTGENGPGTLAQVFFPHGLALDSAGNLYIADSFNQRIRKLTVATGVITTVAGTSNVMFGGDGGAAIAAQLQYPTAVALDANGSIFIADQYNQRVRMAVVPVIPPPTNLTAAVTSATSVRLRWTAAEGATSYTVLRGTAPGTEIVLATNVTDTTFSDDTAVRGTRYYYRVAANYPSEPAVNSAEISFRPTTVPGDVNNDSLPDLIWHNSSTGTNRVWFMSGTTVAGQSDYPIVGDPAWQLVATADVNDDTHLDLLWRNSLTGANVVWYMNGTTILSQVSLPTVADPAWQIVTTADMNQDGKPDIIWHNLALGFNVVWLMDGPTLLSQADLPVQTDAAWILAGAGDLNVDGAPDLVWRNLVTGQNVVWFMNGFSISAAVDLPTVNDPTWNIEAVLDMNADGWADLVWRNLLTGQDVVWLMQGTTLASQIALPTVAEQTWQMIGRPLPDVTVDINGDRHTDLVWRNTASGDNVVWYLNGAQFVSQVAIPAVADVAWQIVAKADLNRDGHPDLIWRNATTGANVVWYMNGTTLLSQVSLPTVADTTWQIVAAADMDGDRHPDLIWRNTASGTNVIWYLNDATQLRQAAFPSVTDSNWRIVAAADVNGDTRPDLIWRNAATGNNVVWYMNDTTLLAQGEFAAVADVNWQIVGSVDVNGDGHPDFIWRNSSTGSNVIWYLNGTTLLSQEALPAVADPNWVLRPN